MSRTGRLTVVGTMIGFMAALLIVLAAGLLVAGLAALMRTSMPPGLAEDWHRPQMAIHAGVGLVAALTVAGAVAGFLAARTRATEGIDRRALVTCLGAAVSWAIVTLAFASGAPSDAVEPAPLVNTTIGLTIVALAGGALVAFALWPPIVRAIAAERDRGLVRSAWVGARRLAAFGFALIAILVAAPLLLIALGGLIRAITGQLPRPAWAAVGAAIVGSVVALGAGVLSLRWAGVPRRWPSAPADQRGAGRRVDQ